MNVQASYGKREVVDVPLGLPLVLVAGDGKEERDPLFSKG